MENERFQDLVLEHLAKLTQEITELKTGQEELRKGQEELRISQGELRKGQEELRISQEELRKGQEELEIVQTELRTSIKELRAGMEELKIRQERVETKLDLVYNHTAQLREDFTVFQASVNADIQYLKYKQAQNEEEIFKIKSYLKMAK
ncbi:MAG: hypothetical protein K6U80_13535 [Firmicutes bacterium]|nr:hypothetical protein [Bacillota bacterium]